MAALSVTLGLLRSEIEARLCALVPTDYADKRFAKREATDTRRIEDCTGRARLFELGEASEIKPLWVGSAYRGVELKIPLVIQYPYSEAWLIAAVDDLDRVGEDLRDNPATIAGVEWRGLNKLTALQREKNTKDPWVVHRVEIMAWILITP